MSYSHIVKHLDKLGKDIDTKVLGWKRQLMERLKESNKQVRL